MYITATIDYHGREIRARVDYEPSEGNGYNHARFTLDGWENVERVVTPYGRTLEGWALTEWLSKVGEKHRDNIASKLEYEAYELSRRGDY